MTLDVDTIDGQNVIIFFIEAAMDPVGREDRTRDLNSEKYNTNLRRENSVEILSKEACDKTINCRSRLMVVYNKA